MWETGDTTLTEREMAAGKAFCAATGLNDGHQFMAGIPSSPPPPPPSPLKLAGGRGTRLHTHLLTKSAGSHVVHSSSSDAGAVKVNRKAWERNGKWA